MDRWFRCLSGLLLTAGCCVTTARAAQETELNDEIGRTIVRYIMQAPADLAPLGADIFPVRESLGRLGLSDDYVLLTIRAQSPRGRLGKADYQPIQKLLARAQNNYPVNPRRVYMYAKGSGGYVPGESTMLYPNLITAGISYSWGWWSMPSELDKAFDAANGAPEFYLVLGMRDCTHHIMTLRDTHERVKKKRYRIIYREFEELGDRSYYPTSNDDALQWVPRLRNKNIPPLPEVMILLKAFSTGQPPTPVSGYYPTLALLGGASASVVLESLFLSTDAAVRAAAETCNQGILNEATTAALGRLLADPSQRVRNAAHRAMASYANWRSQVAQQILIQRATDKTLDVDARIAAARALAEAVKLQAGVQQDPPNV